MPPRTDLHWNLALVYAGLEEKDKAFAHLTNAYKVDERSPAVLKVDERRWPRDTHPDSSFMKCSTADGAINRQPPRKRATL